MKKLLLLTIVLLTIQLNAQNVFRLDKPSKAKIQNISPETLNTILFVEIALQKNANKLKEGNIEIYNPYVKTIKQAYSNKQLTNKKIDSLICYSCYEKEWQKQQQTKELLIKESEYKEKHSPLQKLKDKLNNLDDISARAFSDSIAYSAKTKYTFYKIRNPKKYNARIYYYLKASLTDKQLQDIKDFGCNKNCLKVYFDVYYEGGNVDLEIKGTKKIRFSNVSGKFLDLFPTWKREFIPSATKEGVLDYKKRDIYKGNSAVARLQKIQDTWTIRYYNN